MTNAARIINREIRTREKAALAEGRSLGLSEGLSKGRSLGLSQGITLMAKKLKKELPIEKISQLTGLSEKEIENL